MVRKKIDNRIRVAIENNVATGHRSFFVIVGEKAKDQVVILHHMLSKATIKARPSVLWCYKKELGFSGNRKKKMKKQKNKQRMLGATTADAEEDDAFTFFISSTSIRYCYYSETQKILGKTFGMCVLQDFGAITPNLLARTIETVEGGGIICILLQNLTALNQLCTMNMDVHARYRTEAHSKIACRFNERFILSLAACSTCLVMDDNLNVLPASSRSILNIEKLEEVSEPASLAQLEDIQQQLAETQPVGSLVNLCKSLDQAESLLKMADVISDKSLRHTVSLTAARGRGKSAALGLAIAAAVDFGYSNIFVTSPSPENVSTLFDFIYKGFDVLKYEEHTDYSLVQSTNPNFHKAIIRINIFREHRQTIQYIKPTDASQLGQAELVIIDEAASIPLPAVRSLLGPYIVFLSSTVSGYEGTGRSLSLKLIGQLRQQHSTVSGTVAASETVKNISRSLTELTMKESIRYKPNDPVEKWLNDLLCLDCDSVLRVMPGCPLPEKCSLYYVNRDTLFSYHSASEEFLKRMMSIYVAAHYKNSPNDLQMLSDAPAHQVFVLLPPVDPESSTLPEILVVLQVALEGEISQDSVEDQFSKGRRGSGDLIPWTISQQFQDSSFAGLAGCRIVRIATHPDYQKMGFGSKALELLENYYAGHFVPTNVSVNNYEDAPIKSKSASLLVKLEDRPAEKLDYMGVSFGLTSDLFRFWKKRSMRPVYIRQSANDITGENSCIMLKTFSDSQWNWCKQFNLDFQRRFVSLLAYEFSTLSTTLALNILYLKDQKCVSNITEEMLNFLFLPYDMNRLEMYAKNLTDYHLILDLVPTLANLYFTHRIDVQLSGIQSSVLLAIGLQHKSMELVATELELPVSNILALFCKIVKKFSVVMNSVVSGRLRISLEKSQRDVQPKVNEMKPTEVSLEQDLEEAANEIMTEQRQEKKLLNAERVNKYDITATEEDWQKAIESSISSKTISVARPINDSGGIKRGSHAMHDSVIDSILNPGAKGNANGDEQPNKFSKTEMGKKPKAQNFIAKRLEKRC